MNLGLIGSSLKHSFSKTYFEKKFAASGQNHSYNNFEIQDLNTLHELLSNQKLDGFNVTIPHKEEILNFLDYIEPDAKKIGAVNTVRVADGNLYGYNTDHKGFALSIEDLVSPSIKALILGTGGAAKAVAYALEQLRVEYQFVSRFNQEHLSYEQLNASILNDNRLIINTTPLGMYPNIHQSPDIPYTLIGHDHICYDLIYNPEKTMFLERSESYGAYCMNGKQMLINQAELSYQLWTDQ